MNTRGTRTLTALSLIITATLAGCSSVPFMPAGSGLALESQSHAGRRLTGDFDRAVYSFDDRNTMTLVLLAGPEDQPQQAAVVRMYWQPRAGATPIAGTATNATIQYIVFAGDGEGGDDAGEVGVYSGAGFLFPNSDPGEDSLRAGLWQATVRLSDRSAGFNDLLGKAVLRGDVSARREDALTNDLLRQLNALVSERLGYPRLVEADAPALAPVASLR